MTVQITLKKTCRPSVIMGIAQQIAALTTVLDEGFPSLFSPNKDSQKMYNLPSGVPVEQDIGKSLVNAV